MRLAPKLAALLTLAAAAPLTLALFFTLPASRAALRTQVRDYHVQTADLLAREANATVLAKVQALVLWSSALRFNELSPGREREQALRLIYQQTKDADIVGLFDATGSSLANEAYLEDPTGQGLVNHEAIGERELQAYADHIPLQAALDAKAAVGPVYVVPDRDGKPIPRVVVAVSLNGEKKDERWVIALELSLRPLVDRFNRYSFGLQGRAHLVDAEGRAISHNVLSRIGQSFQPTTDEKFMLGASAVVPLMGWKVFVEQPTDEALSAIHQEAGRATLWVGIGLALALGLGLLAVRTVTVPMRGLQAAANRVAEGDLEAKVNPRGSDELAQLGHTFNEMTQGLRERERLRASFQRYMSDEIANRILSEKSDLDVKGEVAEVTVLFLDVRGFTSIAEHRHPREVIDLLNIYFEQAVRVVIRRGGTINKFLGDGILAVFGLERHDPEAAMAAVQAGLEIQRRVERFNQSRREAGLETVTFGIGINTGRVIAGNVGTAERLEYTIIGDAVNVAQRIQSHAANGNVLMSAETRSRVGSYIDASPCGYLQVKGREQKIEVYAASVNGKAVAPRTALS